MEPPRIVFYDGNCGFCLFWVRVLLQADKKKTLMFSSLQSPLGQQTLLSMGLSTQNLTTLVYFSHNRYYTSSDAVIQIAREIHPVTRILVIFKLIPRKTRNKIYDLIARKRHLFNRKRDVCIKTPDKYTKRFIH